MYDFLRRDFYWRSMAANIYNKILLRLDCPRLGIEFRHLSIVELLSLSSPLKFVTINILGPLPRTKYGIQLIMIIIDRYIKVNQAIQITKITSTQLANSSFNNWVTTYGILDLFLSYNGLQYVRNIFTSIYASLRVKKVTKIAYHSEINGLVGQ